MFNMWSDLEQKVNGKISYIPHLTKNSLMQSKVDEYFNGEAKSLHTLYQTKAS